MHPAYPTSSTTISQDKAAVLAYLRLKHKDPYKGYILCAIVRNATLLPLLSINTLFQSRTVAWNVLVGSVSFASMGPKAMHNASTAQEVTIITPSAANFEFRVRLSFPPPRYALLTSLVSVGVTRRPCHPALFRGTTRLRRLRRQMRILLASRQEAGAGPAQMAP